MIFALSFFLNAATNFAFGLCLSAILGPAEFGRYSTVQLAAITLAVGMLDWLRHSMLRFSGDDEARLSIASSLEAGYFALTLTAYVGVGLLAAFGATFGLGLTLLMLTPLLGGAAHRIDYLGARFRARDEGRPFAGLFGLRQLLCFSLVVGAALWTRSAVVTVAALAVANLVPAIAFSPVARVAGTALRHADRKRIAAFLVYAKPIVFSLVLYQFIALINRQAALAHLGAEVSGKYSLASDLSLRLFGSAISLPELMLFQHVLRLDRSVGRAAAEAQQSRNISLSVGLLAPMVAGYAVMAPSIETILAPAAYRGAFAALSADLAPGYFALFSIILGVGPIFQLQGLTWPLTLAALVALGVDVALVGLTDLSASAEGLALAYSASLASALLAATLLALRVSKVRPRWRDVAAIAAATGSMVWLVRPLNQMSSHLAAVCLAVAIGAALVGGVYLAFDVGGARSFLLERASRLRLGPRRGQARIQA